VTCFGLKFWPCSGSVLCHKAAWRRPTVKAKARRISKHVLANKCVEQTTGVQFYLCDVVVRELCDIKHFTAFDHRVLYSVTRLNSGTNPSQSALLGVFSTVLYNSRRHETDRQTDRQTDRHGRHTVSDTWKIKTPKRNAIKRVGLVCVPLGRHTLQLQMLRLGPQ
jgi:hypothetical protein